MADTFGLSDKINDSESGCLSCGAPLPAERQGQQRFTGGNTTVLVLGGDDKDSITLYDNAKAAVLRLGRKIEVMHITDEDVISLYNLRSLPALVINGSIASQGIISNVDSIATDIEFFVP